MSRHPYLDTRTLARIRDLKLLARLVVDGALHGIHSSRQLGAGLEFNQYRHYEPGDDPRQIDWKLYGRSDRVFVRQSERESHVSVWVLLDTSASMRQPSSEIDDWTRLDCARSLAASLAVVCRRQGDGFGLIGLNDSHLEYLPCRNDDRHLDRFLLTLEALQADGVWPRTDQLNVLWEQLSTPGLVIVISDFFQQQAEIEQLVGKLQAGRQEVLTLQLLTRDEVRFPHRGNLAFVDRETGRALQVDAAAIRDQYLARFDAEARRLEDTLAGFGIRHCQALIEEPLDRTLWRFLASRHQPGLRRAREATV